MKKRTFGGRNGKSRSFGKSSRPAGRSFVKPSTGSKWKSVPNPKSRANRVERKPTPPAFVKKSAAAKLVQSLQDKKVRTDRRLFLVEGEVSVVEALDAGFVPHTLFATHSFLEIYPEILERFKNETQIVDEQELAGMGTLAVNDAAIGVFSQKQLPVPFIMGDEIVIALADVNDPGNLGTIMRIADWYGIENIVASKGTVDAYNPKTISASKGSFARVNVHYADLGIFFSHNKTTPVFAADMRGDNVHSVDFPKRGILLLGNESHGIPDELSNYITKRITIPRFGGAESLNVAIAGAVILDNWLR